VFQTSETENGEGEAGGGDIGSQPLPEGAGGEGQEARGGQHLDHDYCFARGNILENYNLFNNVLVSHRQKFLERLCGYLNHTLNFLVKYHGNISCLLYYVSEKQCFGFGSGSGFDPDSISL
jgi:hypothetical protein